MRQCWVSLMPTSSHLARVLGGSGPSGTSLLSDILLGTALDKNSAKKRKMLPPSRLLSWGPVGGRALKMQVCYSSQNPEELTKFAETWSAWLATQFMSKP